MEESSKTKSILKILKEFTPSIMLALVLAVALTRMIMPSIVHEDSMVPTFHDRDYVMTYRLAYNRNKPERGDIIVFRDDERYLIKRIIGLPGETVTIKDEHVYINDELLDEEYLDDSVKTIIDDDEKDSVVLSKEQYYVMGDNREISLDSRALGPVDNDRITGKVVLRLFPSFRLFF